MSGNARAGSGSLSSTLSSSGKCGHSPRAAFHRTIEKPLHVTTLSVVGLSGTDGIKGNIGVGKSTLCNRLVRPHFNDFFGEHISYLSQVREPQQVALSVFSVRNKQCNLLLRPTFPAHGLSTETTGFTSERQSLTQTIIRVAPRMFVSWNRRCSKSFVIGFVNYNFRCSWMTRASKRSVGQAEHATT